MPTGRSSATLCDVFDADRLLRAIPWSLRVTWIALLVSGGRAVDAALADADPTHADAVRWILLAGWIIGVAAMAVPAVVTLTATRVVVPLSLPVAIGCWVAGAGPVDGAVFTGTAVLSTVVAGTAAFGRRFVQASAYGDEDRHLLRPPLPYLVVAVLAWTAWAAALTVAVIATARGAVVLALITGAIGVAGGALGFPRWHRLSRRWLVLVPAGLVVHDHVVLAETLMIRRQELARLGLAPAGTDAADFTGPAPGHAVEIRTTESITALAAMVPGVPAGGALHLTGLLVAPTRPGQALSAAAARRFPVGPIG